MTTTAAFDALVAEARLNKLLEELQATKAERDRYRDEADLLTDERDMALYERDRERRAHEIHHGRESR